MLFRRKREIWEIYAADNETERTLAVQDGEARNFMGFTEVNMELKRFLYTFLRMFWLIILLGSVGLGVTIYLYGYGAVPVYTADTKIFTLAKGSADSSRNKIDYQDILTNRQLSNDYQDIIKSKKVIEMSQRQLSGMKIDPDRLKSMISVNSQDNSSIVVIRAVSADAGEAGRVSLAVSNSFISTLEELTKTDIVGVIDEPGLPSSPVQPDNLKQILMGLLIGIGTAIIIIYIADFFDTRIRFKEDIEHYTKLPMLAVIPKYNIKSAK